MLEEGAKELQALIETKNAMITDLRTQIDYEEILNQNLTSQLSFVQELFEDEKKERKILSERIQEFCGIKPREITTHIKKDENILPVAVGRKYPSRKDTISLLTKRSEKLAEEAKKKTDEAINSGQLAPEAQEVIL